MLHSVPDTFVSIVCHWTNAETSSTISLFESLNGMVGELPTVGERL